MKLNALPHFTPGHHPRLLTTLLVISILGLGLLFFTIYSEVSTRIRQDRERLMTETAGALSTHIDQWLDENIRTLKTASRQPAIKAMDPSGQTKILSAVQNEYHWMYLVFTLDRNGRNIARSDGGALKDYSDRAYFKALAQGKSIAWQTLVGKTSEKPALVIALPIIRGGRFQGVLAAAMTTDAVSSSVAGWQYGKSGFAVLMDENRNIIAHPEKQLSLDGARLRSHPLLQLDPSRSSEFRAFDDGVAKIGAIRRNTMGWHLIIEQEQADAYRELYTFQKFMFLVFGSVVIMVLAIAWLYARISVSPVIKMINAGLHREKDLKKQLQEMRKMEALGTFAGGIAHDFNNILGAITTCSEMAIEDVEESNPAHEDLKHILKAATRGKKLVKQILEYSRSRNTRQKPVKLHRIILECLDLFKAFKPDAIKVKLNIASKLDFILADPTQVHQVIMNLLLNAEHAITDGKGTLTITLTQEEASRINLGGIREQEATHFLHLSVADTGCGMEPQILERMFDPFFTTHMNTGGTGLGLAMSDVIIRRHQGVITAESEVGQGSTFHIYLPCIGDGEILDEEDQADPVAMTGTETILFVDDDEHMLYSGAKMLQRLGYRVESAENADKALSRFKASPSRFDLVITDRVMPGHTGVELAHMVRQIRPDIPIIMCSGFFNKKDDVFLDTEYDLEGLIDETISKPFEIKPISVIIRKVLDGKRSNGGL